MYEPVYSSHGGAPKGYVCRVIVRNKKGKERFCNKPCKTLWDMQAHGLRKHGTKLQMEMFDGEKVQADTNAQYVRAATEHARANAGASGNTALDGLFAALRAREEEKS